ncbi:hypothetical protein CPB83DRAFT_849840 [Crepidotus variabilis]|uniref:LysM domain-containing protein n=1 Tax=Crepidotus variabilis TaxID=179855 RepID=A0A9P6EJK5_9AGAR|nr:hypothetical protein CPB83DRAFT_849840 [Crepidotus variabilis]
MTVKVFSTLLAAIASAIAVFAATSVLPTDPTCSRTYTIQSGDYCYKISRTQNVSTYQLASVNEGIIAEDCSNLSIGEQICLGIIGHDCTHTYVVQVGDSCESIATVSDITVADIHRLNPQLVDGCPNLYAESTPTSEPARALNFDG